MITQKKRRANHVQKFLNMVLVGFLLGFTGNMTVKADNLNAGIVSEQQQTVRRVTGRVVDIDQEPLIGVSVRAVGSAEGTVTDFNGQYTISVRENQVLSFSYLGFKTITANANRDVINITLQEDAQALSEVVVVGYGTQKKENLTGAVASVDIQKTLEGRAIPDAGKGLQGSTPGLFITFPSAEVGDEPIIRIRGQFASFQGTSTPLILLDNVEIPSLSLVNPDDIESISILKDAASASIYGAKGASGVVLITTKKGAKSESVNLTYSNNFSWQNQSQKWEMGGVEALEFAWLAAKNLNPGATLTGAFWYVDDQSLAKAKEWQKNYGGKLGPNDPMVYGRDWYTTNGTTKFGLRTYDPYEYLIREWAPTQNHNVSVNGRAGKTTYNVGLNYMDQSGMNKAAKVDKFTRYTGTIRLSTELNKFVSVHAGSMYSTREKQFPYVTNSYLDQWYYLYRWGPHYPLGYDENNNIIRSPYSEYATANTGSIKRNYTSYNVGTVVTFTKDWTFNFDYTHANTEFRQHNPGTRFTAAESWYAPVARNDASGNPVYVNDRGEVVAAGAAGAMRAYDLDYYTYVAAASNPDHIRTNTSNNMQNTINAYTTYDLTLNTDHAFKFMAGLNRVTEQWVSQWQQITTLTDFENPQYNFAIGTQTTGGDFGWQSQLGYFGRVNYAFKNRYLLEGNIRYDGSSKFPVGLKWRWFPSFSAGWVATEEAFMEGLRPALSFLKFRGSFGIIGDQTVPGSLYLPRMSSGQLTSWLDAGGTVVSYVSYPSAVSSDITWQDFQTTNIGLDARFLNNKIGVTFDWFRKDTKNMLVPNETSTNTYGIGAPIGNYGSLRTNGWELSLDFNHRFSNGIGINGMATLSDAVTKITKYGKGRTVTGWYEGKTYGEIWGFRHDRLYQKDDFVYDANGNFETVEINGRNVYKLKGDNPVYQRDLEGGSFYFQPGDTKYKDLNGDGKISLGDNTVENPGDREVIGNTTPRYEYGFRLGADFKGFDFSVFFQGVGKRNLWGSSGLTLAGFNPADGAIAKTLCTDYWTENNTNAFYPRPWPNGNETDIYSMRVQDKYLLNMAYTRLKNITFGYTAPTSFVNKLWVKKARIYVAAENLFTWDKLNGLPIDPEIIPGISMFDSNNNYQGSRAGVGVPPFKNVSLGIQLTF